MSTSIDQAFVKEFEDEVFMAYQRRGSKLRGTVRTKSGILAKDTTYFKAGTGTASVKARHGKVPTMNASHSSVTCTLGDYYAADWIDKLDLLKTELDERSIVAQTGAWALGRKTDALIVDALDDTTNAGNIVHGGAGLTKTKVLKVFELFNGNDVPDDGDRFFAVGAQQWNDLLGITEFASADYVGYDSAPWATGLTAKRWLGMNFFMFSGLTKASTTRTCLAYHKWSAGHAIGAEIMLDVSWHGDHAAWFVNNMMSQGAVLIDSNGILKVEATEV